MLEHITQHTEAFFGGLAVGMNIGVGIFIFANPELLAWFIHDALHPPSSREG